MDYGAKCDGATDDSPAINAAVDQVRTIITANPNAAVVLEFPTSMPDGAGGATFRRCICNSTLNFTGIFGLTQNVTVECHGTQIYGNMDGAPVIDALGSNMMIWRNLSTSSAAGPMRCIPAFRSVARCRPRPTTAGALACAP